MKYVNVHYSLVSTIIALVFFAQANAGQIQDAIDAAESGDVVTIDAGIYYESLLLKEGISLVGAGSGRTFIDGSGADIVITGAKNSVIMGCTIQNGLVGVYNNNTTTHVIECHIRHVSKYAIQFTAGFGVIANNIIEGTGKEFGVHSENANPYLYDNIIVDCYIGLLTRGLHTPTSNRNAYFQNSFAGIVVDGRANIKLNKNEFFGNTMNIRGFSLDQSDLLLLHASSIEVPETGISLQEYKYQIAKIMSDVFSEHPVVIYTLGDSTGKFGMAGLHPKANFKVRSSSRNTEIIRYDAFDLETEKKLNADYFEVEKYPAISVYNPTIVENSPERYALDTLFHHNSSYFLTENGMLVFNRLTSYTRIEVVVPHGFMPISSDHETIYDWQNDQVVAKITDIGYTPINLVMAPLPETIAE